MNRSCLCAVCSFFQLWQFLINFVCIQLWGVLRAEMRKPCLKMRLTVLHCIMQFQNNGVPRHQINSSACGLMMFFSYFHAIPVVQSAEILTVENWMVTLHFLLIEWLNTVCVNTLVILFGFVAFIFRWLRVSLSPFAPDHIQQSLFHRKGRFTVLGSKWGCILACDVTYSVRRTDRLDQLVRWDNLIKIWQNFVSIYTSTYEEQHSIRNR